MKRRGLLLLLTVSLCACRFGGTGGDALALLEPAVDGGLDAAADGDPPGSTFDSGPTGTPQPEGAPPDGSVVPPPDGAAGDGSTGDSSMDAAADAAACQSAALPGCDPVRNEGCTDGVTQCVLNPEASEPTGHCVLAGLGGEPCTESLFSTSCLPQHTCVEGACRRFCSCDSDCENGQVCSDPIGVGSTGAVKLCAAP